MPQKKSISITSTNIPYWPYEIKMENKRNSYIKKEMKLDRQTSPLLSQLVKGGMPCIIFFEFKYKEPQRYYKCYGIYIINEINEVRYTIQVGRGTQTRLYDPPQYKINSKSDLFLYFTIDHNGTLKIFDTAWNAHISRSKERSDSIFKNFPTKWFDGKTPEQQQDIIMDYVFKSILDSLLTLGKNTIKHEATVGSQLGSQLKVNLKHDIFDISQNCNPKYITKLLKMGMQVQSLKVANYTRKDQSSNFYFSPNFKWYVETTTDTGPAKSTATATAGGAAAAAEPEPTEAEQEAEPSAAAAGGVAEEKEAAGKAAADEAERVRFEEEAERVRLEEEDAKKAAIEAAKKEAIEEANPAPPPRLDIGIRHRKKSSLLRAPKPRFSVDGRRS